MGPMWGGAHRVGSSAYTVGAVSDGIKGLRAILARPAGRNFFDSNDLRRAHLIYLTILPIL